MKKLLLIFILIPFINFGQVQIGSDIISEYDSDSFGSSLDCSSDGNIIVIGASYSSENGTYSGHVRIYENITGVWTQLGSDIVGEHAFNFAGYRVALNSNGNIIAVTDFIELGETYKTGRVRVFVFQAGEWVQYGTAIYEEENGDNFGVSLSLNSNGNILAIGATHNDGIVEDSGHVRIYENISGVWTQIGSDIDGEISDAWFGGSVSLNNNGDIVAIGARTNNENGEDSGQVQIFENISDEWIQIGSDINGQSETDRSGQSIDLNGNGNIIAIGSPGNDDYRSNAGYIRVFENISGEWIQKGSVMVGEAVNNYFGAAVSLNNVGNIVAGGAPDNGGGGTFSGHVRIHQYESGVWVRIGPDIDGEDTSERLGTTVALNDEGNILVAGAPAQSIVRVFDLTAALSTKEQATLNFNIYPNPTKAKFTIQLENNAELESVNIYNKLGQLVLTSKETIIDTSKLASGLYVVEIETTKGKSSKKLIIQ